MPRRLSTLVCVIALYTAILGLAPRPPVVAQDSTGTTTRVSVSSDGMQADGHSSISALSADGRYVAFASIAGNLVAGDTNGLGDVFVHDRQMGVTSRVSISSDGAQTNGESGYPSLSADGRYVVFASMASNLVAGDTNGAQDVFIHDRQTAVTSLVSISTDGTQGNDGSWKPILSADGRVVAFVSKASNLVAGDTKGLNDIFVHDRQTGITSRVSVHSDGTQANYHSINPALSADGRYVAFETSASNLADEDANDPWWDVFVHDRQTRTTSLVSISSDGKKGNHNSRDASFSSDGRFVVFDSYAMNLIAEDTNNRADVFVHDRQTSSTTLISVRSDGVQANADSVVPFLSPDGRYVIFDSYATNLVAGDTNSVADVFVYDRQTGDTSVVSVSSDGTWGNGQSFGPSISADGRFVVFESYASNLVAGDTNGVNDIFIHERQGAAFAPSITGFDPTSGPIGAPVTIDGANFSRATAVTFNGTSQPSFTVSPDGTQITTAVPIGATTGRINVTTSDGTAESATDFTVIPAPAISGFSPAAGPVGTAVTITGVNFAGATAVAFNGASQPSFTVNPDGTQATAAVPAGATTGKISVTTPGGTAESATDFTVIPAPAISGFSPAAGPVGTAVTITGANFAGATAVAFNGTSQPAFSVSPDGTQISAAAPAGAATGKITVTTPAGTATSTTDFIVTPPPAVYLSPTGSGKIGPVAASKAFTNADILTYVKATNTWDILYDGSTIKTTKNVGAFAFVGNDILLGFSAAQVVPGLGTTKVAAQDLVRFTPTSTGYNNTAGTFAWYFDGSDAGLTTAAEAIDALWIDAQGRLYVSTAGTGEVPADSANPTGAKVKFQDEDVLRFTPSSTGATTAGTWTLYWDPTLMTGMSAEDINGYWEDPATGARYVTILGAFNIGNTAYGGKFAGNGKTILRFAPNGAAPGGWAPAEKVTWLAAGATFPSNIDAIEMAR